MPSVAVRGEEGGAFAFHEISGIDREVGLVFEDTAAAVDRLVLFFLDAVALGQPPLCLGDGLLRLPGFGLLFGRIEHFEAAGSHQSFSILI